MELEAAPPARTCARTSPVIVLVGAGGRGDMCVLAPPPYPTSWSHRSHAHPTPDRSPQPGALSQLYFPFPRTLAQVPRQDQECRLGPRNNSNFVGIQREQGQRQLLPSTQRPLATQRHTVLHGLRGAQRFFCPSSDGSGGLGPSQTRSCIEERGRTGEETGVRWSGEGTCAGKERGREGRGREGGTEGGGTQIKSQSSHPA